MVGNENIKPAIPQELDREVAKKEKVQVRVVLPNVKTYHAYADDYKTLTERAGGTIAVKMVCK